VKKTKQPMPEPVFRLKLVYADGGELMFDGGGAFERDLIRVCREAIVKRGVGFTKTEAHVAKDIDAGLTEAIMSLKRESLKVV
jgi:hypothetical protein